MPDVGGRVEAELEVDALDHRVDRDAAEWPGANDGAVVAGSDQDTSAARWQQSLDRLDQRSLGHLYSLTPPVGTRTRILITLLVVVGILVFLIGQVDRLPDFRFEPRPVWLLPAVALMLIFYAIQATAWAAIARALGGRIDGRAGRAVWGKSMLSRYIGTSAMMVVGRVVLAGRLGVGRRVCVASIVYELAIGISVAATVGATVVIGLPFLAETPFRFAVLGILPVALAALHPQVFRPFADRVLRRFDREPLPVVLTFGAVLRFVPVYLVVWSCAGLALFCVASAAVPISAADLIQVAASQPAAFCVGLAAFMVPSGLGAREAALTLALTVVLPLPVAAAIAVAFRLFQVLIEVVFTGVVVGLARRGR